MDFGRNFVVTKSPKFMDFGLSPANTPDKTKYVIVPTTRYGELTNGSDWLWPRNDIEEVIADRVSGTKEKTDNILKSDLETMRKIQYFERDNISTSRPTLDLTNISMG